MIEHLSTLFNALMGAELPEVVPLILAFVLSAILVKKFFDIFGLDSKLWTFAAYVIIGYLAVSSLGGLVWNFSLS